MSLAKFHSSYYHLARIPSPYFGTLQPTSQIRLRYTTAANSFEDLCPSEDRWMVTPWWWVIETLCGLTLCLVLQVQVAAWFALVQVKNKCKRSIHVWPLGVERQVGLVRTNWWPTGSSVDLMVARRVRRSHVRFFDWATKQRSSRDDHVSQVMSGIGVRPHQVREVCNGSTQNTLGFSVEPQTEVRDSTEEERPPRPVWLPRSQHREASKWRIHSNVARLAWSLLELVVCVHPSDGDMTKIPKVPFGSMYLTIM
jgi:hypothetical protein